MNSHSAVQKSPLLRDKVKQLRRTFIEGLPRTLGEARQLCAQLMQSAQTMSAQPTGERDTLSADLFRLFHGIKGTSASLGLMQISQEGGIGEHLVLDIQHCCAEVFAATDEAIDSNVEALLACIARLERLQQEHAEDEDHGVTRLPSFEIESKSSFTNQNKKKIYVCDDDEWDAQQLSSQLACFGFSVSVFTTPEGLRAAVLAAQPAAVIMDIVFPNGAATGTELIAALRREIRTPPPVVFVSARNDFDARLRAVKAGGEAYFVKPLKAIDIVEILDSLTANREPEPYRILVIDDEAPAAAYHSFILEQVGMQTRILNDTSLILSTLADFKPDLVLMDMYMPICSGRELAQLIRQVPEFVSLPIVFLSSETNKNKQTSALRVGAEGFLTKPIQPEDLVNAVAIRAERTRTLQGLMIRDGLTGLFNHSFMSQYLETALANTRRDDKRLCFVMIDVDLFKLVNDTYGHAVGDQVLVALARLLQQRLRNSDTVGRYGGEEFVIILQDANEEGALRIIDTLREDFSKITFHADEHEFSCSFSAGIACFPDSSSSDQLRENADRALYEAKRTGRNRVLIADNHSFRTED